MRDARMAVVVDWFVMAGLFVLGVVLFGLVGPAFAPRGASGPFALVYLYVGLTFGLGLALAWSVVARIRGRRRPIDGLTEVATIVYVVTTGVAYLLASYLYSGDQAPQSGTASGGAFLGGVLAGVVIGPLIGLLVGLMERARGRMAAWQVVVGVPLGLGLVVAGFVAYLALYQGSLG